MIVTGKELIALLGENNVLANVPLKDYSTFKIGGPARFIVFPNSVYNLISLIDYLKFRDEKFFILGGGSNCLFADDGFNGVVISLSKLKIKNSCNRFLTMGAGERLSSAIKLALDNSFSGLEWAIGIPASVGGAVVMNSGAFGGQMSQIINKVWAIENGEIRQFSPQDCCFGYRDSVFQQNGAVIIKVQFKLERGEKSQIISKMHQTLLARHNLQPAGFSAGSVFKKANEPAGKLIDEAGLKGERIGGAFVSPKHANFILNDGTATASDVLKLIKKIKREVYFKFKTELETEIKLIGENDENNRRLPHS